MRFPPNNCNPRKGRVNIITVPSRLTSVMICPFSSSFAWMEGAIEAIAEEPQTAFPPAIIKEEVSLNCSFLPIK